VILFDWLLAKFPRMSPRRRFYWAVLVSWILVVVHRWATLPIQLLYMRGVAEAEGRDSDMIDGTGGTGAILIFGWILPFFALSVYVFGKRLWVWTTACRKRR
jgi:hypothetical protein